LRVLFLPSHVGLGHVARSVAVARVLRGLVPGVVVEWCTAEPAAGYLGLWGERLAPGCRGMESLTPLVEAYIEGRMGVLELGRRLGPLLRGNYEVLRGLVESGRYSLVYADEAWELVYAAQPGERRGTVFATDFVYKPYSLNPAEALASLAFNRYIRRSLRGFRRLLYLNTLDTVEGRHWLPLGLGGRVDEWIREHMLVAGLATSILPGDPPSREEARRRLGAGSEELLVAATIGGTRAADRQLLDCLAAAAPMVEELARRRLGKETARIIVARGPRSRWEPPDGLRGLVETRGAQRGLAALYQAADVVLTRAGRTTTADLHCLARPALLAPMPRHFEQEEIARAMRRYGYPVLPPGRCRPRLLAEKLAEAAATQPTQPPPGACRGSIAAAEELRRSLAG
jgi:hypothetical protein